jgi:hypothetical protein
MAKGKKTGGRRKGSIPIDRKTVQEILSRLGVDPFEGMAKIALGDVQCNRCLGKLVSPVQLPDGEHSAECSSHEDPENSCDCEGITLRKCQSCKGTGRELVSPELRGKMYAELANYDRPKLRAIEHSADPDNPIKLGMTVKFVKANAPS